MWTAYNKQTYDTRINWWFCNYDSHGVAVVCQFMSSVVQLSLSWQVNELLTQIVSDKTGTVIGQKVCGIFTRWIKTLSRFVFCKVRNDTARDHRFLIKYQEEKSQAACVYFPEITFFTILSTLNIWSVDVNLPLDRSCSVIRGNLYLMTCFVVFA